MPKLQEQTRTALVPVCLSAGPYRQAHDACHTAASLWNAAVDWVHAQWREDRNPSKYEVRAHLTSLPRDERPLHAHTTETVAYDLHEAIRTACANRKAGTRASFPWRHKNYRPLTFTKNFGWRITKDGELRLSLGRGRRSILLPIPTVMDSVSVLSVQTQRWVKFSCVGIWIAANGACIFHTQRHG